MSRVICVNPSGCAKEFDSLCHSSSSCKYQHLITGWVSVNDSLPQPGVTVLIVSERGVITLDETYQGEWILWPVHNNVTKPGNRITHWMELPEPPESYAASQPVKE